jgi:mono/diheme cytochrome c family protein
MTTMKKTWVLCAALLVGGATAVVFEAVAADDPADGDTSAGGTLYESLGCWACHGFSGQGANSRGIASGPRIDARRYPRDAFLLQLRHPMNAMPPYTANVLSDAQADAIYAYLKSIPAPRPAGEIPLLQGR